MIRDPATLEPMVFPEPVISVAIAPRDKGGNEKLGVALNKMVQEDPSFQVSTDEDSGDALATLDFTAQTDPGDFVSGAYAASSSASSPSSAWAVSI